MSIIRAVANLLAEFRKENLTEPLEIKLASAYDLRRLDHILRDYLCTDVRRGLADITIFGLKFTTPCPTCGCSHHSKHT